MRLLALAAPLRSRSPPCRPPKRARIPAAAPPNRSTVSSRRTRRAKTRRQTRKPSRAFPIAPNRPAPSFNPAYVRSPSAKTQPARQRPHITLQIHSWCKAWGNGEANLLTLLYIFMFSVASIIMFDGAARLERFASRSLRVTACRRRHFAPRVNQTRVLRESATNPPFVVTNLTGNPRARRRAKRR